MLNLQKTVEVNAEPIRTTDSPIRYPCYKSFDEWISKWTAENTAVGWIAPGLIYHEVCAVQTAPRTIKLWDPSAGWWMNSQRVKGYGSLRALRVFVQSAEASMDQLIFDEHRVVPNKWQVLKAAKSGTHAVSVSSLSGPPPIESEKLLPLGDASSF